MPLHMAGSLGSEAVVPVVDVLSVEILAVLAMGVRVLLVTGAEDALEKFHDGQLLIVKYWGREQPEVG